MCPRQHFASTPRGADVAALLLDQGAIALGELAMRSPRIRASRPVCAYSLDLLAFEQIIDVHASAPFSPGKGERDLSHAAAMSQSDAPAVSLYSTRA